MMTISSGTNLNLNPSPKKLRQTPEETRAKTRARASISKILVLRLHQERELVRKGKRNRNPMLEHCDTEWRRGETESWVLRTDPYGVGEIGGIEFTTTTHTPFIMGPPFQHALILQRHSFSTSLRSQSSAPTNVLCRVLH